MSSGIPQFVMRLKNLFTRRNPGKTAAKQTEIEKIRPTKKAPSEHFLKKLERQAFGNRGGGRLRSGNRQGGTLGALQPISLGVYGEKHITGPVNWTEKRKKRH